MSATKTQLPIKVLQFGEGNFLRAFVDWMIQKANDSGKTNAGVAIVQPLDRGLVPNLKAQDCKYNVILEGIKGGEPIREIQKIDCVMDAVNPYAEYEQYKDYFLNPELEFIISNTTEAGIVKLDGDDVTAEPPASFPGKVTALLLERFNKYDGAANKGLTFICCELIEDNASTLKSIVLELADENSLSQDFIQWINSSCTFCNSLVDRIVTGFPKDKIEAIQEELGKKDNMVVTAEYYHQWAIEAPAKVQQQFPLDQAGLNIVWTENMKAYRDKKVRILNGAHTALVPVSLLAGYETVKEAFADNTIETFVRALISDEVIPNIQEDKAEVEAFADAILERFFNPFIKHYLKDISLNSISKWVTRDLPSFQDDYLRKNALPQNLTLSLAALIELYVGDNGFVANDTHPSLEALLKTWKTDDSIEEKVKTTLSDSSLWSVDLSLYDGMVALTASNIRSIRESGILETIKAQN